MKNSVFFQNKTALVVFATALLFVGSIDLEAPAQEAESLTTEKLDAERFQMKRDGETIIRLDKKTGAMSTCQMKGQSLICRMAADEREALEKEIASLQLRLEENKANETNDQTAQLEPKAETEDKKQEDKALDRELDKMVDLSSKILRRFFTVMKDLKNDLAQ